MAKIDPIRLRMLREGRGLSQERLADIAAVDKQTISRIEREMPKKRREITVTRLARALGVDPVELAREAPAPEAGQSEPLKRKRQSSFRVSDNANNFLYLISERYFVRPWQVLELAPLLFCWAAEMSLRERRERIKKLEEACRAARTLEKEMPHLPPANLTHSEEKIAAESRSIDAHDIFGMCFGDNDFSEGLPHSLGDDTDNPFAIFLAKLADEIGDVARFEGFSPIDYPCFEVCRDEALEMVGGDETLARRILSGVVDLYDMPKDLHGFGNTAGRAAWVRAQAEAFILAHIDAADRRQKSGEATP
jgi:transcriptional regulator with XRE-family HTH domain